MNGPQTVGLIRLVFDQRNNNGVGVGGGEVFCANKGGLPDKFRGRSTDTQ
jgi:hypothetical protein